MKSAGNPACGGATGTDGAGGFTGGFGCVIGLTGLLYGSVCGDIPVPPDVVLNPKLYADGPYRASAFGSKEIVAGAGTDTSAALENNPILSVGESGRL